MRTWSRLNIVICESECPSPKKLLKITTSYEYQTDTSVVPVVQIHIVDLQSLMKHFGQRRSFHCSENMTSPSLPPSHLSCLFSLFHTLYPPSPVLLLPPSNYFFLSFFLKLWHHLVWDVVVVLMLASRWQPWLMGSAFYWKTASLQYQDEVILLKNILCILIHSFKSCNFQSLKATRDLMWSCMLIKWSQLFVNTVINLKSL